MQEESRRNGASTALSAVSPSFTSYTSEYLTDIAARVVHELNLSHDDPYDDDFYSSTLHQHDAVDGGDAGIAGTSIDELAVEHDYEAKDDDDQGDDESEGEFEFAVLCGGEEYTSPISADEIFYNGQIKPVYPLFNTDLVYGHQPTNAAVTGRNESTPTTLRLSLRRLMKEERERGNDSVSSSGSSSDNTELEGVPEGTYCVWAPKKKSDEEVMKKKSNSTGASSGGGSKRWRFRDLLYRSNSDGKDTFVFLTPSQHHHHNHRKITAVNSKEGKRKGGVEEKNKKKSYLPYRQDLVGFFANVNGVSRTVRPF